MFLSSIKSPRCRIPFIADRSFERERFFGDLQGSAYSFKRHVELFGEFLRVAPGRSRSASGGWCVRPC